MADLSQDHRSLAEQVIEQPLIEARLKRQKLEAFKVEADDLDAAIKDLERVQEKAVERRMKRVRDTRKPSTTGKPTGHNVRGASRSRVEDFLRESGELHSPAEVAAETGMKGPYVSQLLSELVGAGEVEKIGRGAYRIKHRENGVNPSESAPVEPGDHRPEPAGSVPLTPTQHLPRLP